MAEENIADRLKFLLQKLNISSSAFADTCGISRATFSQLLTGRNKKISDVLVGQIHHAYPALSVLWLMFNEGPMWIGEPDSLNARSTDSAQAITSNEINNSGLPFQNTARDDWNSSENNETILSDGNGLQAGSVSSAENTFENSIFTANSWESRKSAKENGLKIASAPNNSTVNKEFNSSQKLSEISHEIEKERFKTRKVVQVTIYYDDSTFETLFPR